MKNDLEIGTPGPEEMKELIASLSPSERATLNDSNFITEDEVDLITLDRSAATSTGPGITLDELLAKEGLSRGMLRRRAKV